MSRDLMSALNITPDGKAPKNPFDLSSFHTLSQKGGQFNIVGVVDTVPNSDYRMSVDGFTRTIINNTANFARIKENYYFVHVPLGLINRNAYQLQVQRKEQYSALDFGISKMPFFDLKTVLKRLAEVCAMNSATAQANGFVDVHGFNMGFGALKLLDMLGYGSYQDLIESMSVSGGLTLAQVKAIIDNFPSYKPNANRLAAYQCVWYHFFRNDIYDCNVSAKSFNFDDVTAVSGTVDPTSNYNILSVRTVDDFIKQCLQLRYVPYKKDIFMASMPGTQFGAVSSVSVSADISVSLSGTGTVSGLRGSFTGIQGTVSGYTNDSDSRYGLNDQNGNPVTLEPEEWPFGGTVVPIIQGSNSSAGLNNRSANVVVGKLEVAQDGTPDHYDVNVDGASYRYVHDHTFSTNFTPQGTVSIDGTGSVSVVGGTLPAGTSLFDVLSLVEAQAIQKWRQKSMLAGNRTTAQFKAHHGEVPKHLIDHLPDFIGSVDNEIQITEITSQSDTASAADESNLGEIAGRGYGASDARTFQFHSDDYGILMLLHAIVPENTYSSYGLDAGNTMISYSDFFQQEFMNLGLQAVPNYLLNAHDNNALTPGQLAPEGTGTETFTTDLGILGYAPRYFNYKQYVSKVHGFFNPSRLAAFGYTPSSKFGYADMQSFVLTRSDMVPDIYSVSRFNGFQMTLSKLYVNPHVFDSIFAQDASDSEITDEFFTHVKFECSSLLPMSVLGLPQF